MIKRSQLRQFIAVVDTGSFTRAAERVNVTQPTLSAGIAELERLAGARLFLRDRRGVRLTDAGNRLLVHARGIEREFRLAEAVLVEAAPAAAPVRLGVIASLATAQLERLAAAWKQTRPLVLVEGNDAGLRKRLSEGQIDMALTLLRAEDKGRGAVEVLHEPYLVMLPEAHPLAGRERIEPTELAGEVMIARRSCEILAETSRFFTQRGVRPAFFLRSANDDRCMAMVRAGQGITTAPLSLGRPGVRAVPLADYDFVRSVGLVTRGAGLAEEGAALRSACTRAFEERT